MVSESAIFTLDIGGDSDVAVNASDALAEALLHLADAAQEASSAASAIAGPSNEAEAAVVGLGTSAGEAGGEMEGASHQAETAGVSFSDLSGIVGSLSGDLGEASGKFGEVGSSISEMIGSDEGIGLAGMAGVATAAAGALAFLGHAGGDLVTENMRIASTLGLTSEEAHKLALTFENAGSSGTVLIRMGGILSTTMTQAADAIAKGHEPSLKARTLMDELGVSILDTNGKLRSQGEVLTEALTKLGNMEDKTAAARIASELFGSRMAGQVIPVIAHWNELSQTASEQAEKLSGGMKDGDEKAIKYHESMTELNVVFQELSLKALPALIGGMEGLKDAIDAAETAWEHSPFHSAYKLGQDLRGFTDSIGLTHAPSTSNDAPPGTIGVRGADGLLTYYPEGSQSLRDAQAGQYGPLPPGRASGGAISAGVPYIVGENGPEIRVFDQPGSIIPNGANGGASSGDIHVHVYLDGSEISHTVEERQSQRLGLAARGI